MPAQVKYHAQVQATYDYYGHHYRRQQESQEDALQVARDYHCQALAAAALLEGHLEQLSCSISQGLYGSQSRRQLGSCWQLGSRRHSRSHGHSRSCRRHLLGQTPGTDTPGGRLPLGFSQEADRLPQPIVTHAPHLQRYKLGCQSRNDP